MMNEPIHDPDAERAVLGSVLLSPDAAAAVIDVVNADDFYAPRHARVFEACLALYNDGEPIDAVTVGDRLAASGDLDRAGGRAFLYELAEAVPVATNAAYYADIVAERATVRRLATAGQQITEIAYKGGTDVTDLIASATSTLASVTRTGTPDYRVLADVMDATLDEVEAAANRGGTVTGVPTGYRDLDSTLHGLQPGQVIVVAARPAMGKSMIAVDLCRHVAFKVGDGVALFSLEMSATEIGTRVLAAEAQVMLHQLRSGHLSDADWGKIAGVQARVRSDRFYVDDSPNMTIPEIRAKATRLVHEHGVKFIVIDYLQLMSSGTRVESRQAEVAQFSRALKLLAKELRVPVVVLSQLNRNSADRSDHLPQMSDLRESGAIEQDADVVILLHREDYYDKQSARPGEADLIVAKHRNGPTGTVPVAFQGHYSRFVDMAEDEAWAS